MSTRKSYATSVSGLDTLLGGGLPQGQMVIICGEPGTGKTVLSSQMAFSMAGRNEQVVLATLSSESQDKLLLDLDGFTFFDRKPIGDTLFFLSAYSAFKKGATVARDLLINTVRERKAKLLVLDGFRAVRDLWRNEAELREFLYELNVAMTAHKCTLVITAEYPLELLRSYPEATTVDGIIAMERVRVADMSRRSIEVVKLRGRRHLTGQHTFSITDEGVVVIPRIEALNRRDQDYVPPRSRAAFGLTALDGLAEGGLVEESATLIAGSAGVGKTLLALHFAAEAARSGRRTLFYSFDEAVGSLVFRAARIGLELESFISQGLLTFVYPPPVEAGCDELVADILKHQQQHRATALVVDGVNYLERTATLARLYPFFSALLSTLRERKVTSVFTKPISKLVGPELDFSDTPLASMAENLIFVRHVELLGRMHRVLSILNLRDSAFDPSVREFRIGSNGLQVLEPFASAAGLLTGQARPIGTWASGSEKPGALAAKDNT